MNLAEVSIQVQPVSRKYADFLLRKLGQLHPESRSELEKVGELPHRDAQLVLQALAEKWCQDYLDLARLYKHYMPHRTRTPKSLWSWAAAITEPTAGDLRLRVLRVTPAYIEALTGTELRRIPNEDGLPPGFYLPNGAALESSPAWPDTDSLVETMRGCKLRTLSLRDAEVYLEKVRGSDEIYIIDEHFGILLNRLFAAAWITPGDRLNVRYNPRNGATMVESPCGALAIVAGCRRGS